MAGRAFMCQLLLAAGLKPAGCPLNWAFRYWAMISRVSGIFMDDVAAVDAREVAAAAGAVAVGHHVELLGRGHGLAVEGETR